MSSTLRHAFNRTAYRFRNARHTCIVGIGNFLCVVTFGIWTVAFRLFLIYAMGSIHDKAAPDLHTFSTYAPYVLLMLSTAAFGVVAKGRGAVNAWSLRRKDQSENLSMHEQVRRYGRPMSFLTG